MKRIYLLLLLMVMGAGEVFAQKDIKLIVYNRNPDTMKYNAAGAKTFYVFVWGFVNVGSVPFTNTDTIKFRSWTRGGATLNLILPSGGIPVGDTVSFRDTIGWKGGPTGSPANFTMCDSIWTKTGSTINTENTSDNKVCRTIYWMQDPLSVEEFDVKSQSIVVYPNPVKGILNLKYNFGSNSDAKVRITNLLGSVVYTKDLSQGLHGLQEIPLDISGLKPGLHMVELLIDNERKTTKITVIE